MKTIEVPLDPFLSRRFPGSHKSDNFIPKAHPQDLSNPKTCPTPRLVQPHGLGRVVWLTLASRTMVQRKP
jgi:hypothetical protein